MLVMIIPHGNDPAAATVTVATVDGADDAEINLDANSTDDDSLINFDVNGTQRDLLTCS